MMVSVDVSNKVLCLFVLVWFVFCLSFTNPSVFIFLSIHLFVCSCIHSKYNSIPVCVHILFLQKRYQIISHRNVPIPFPIACSWPVCGKEPSGACAIVTQRLPSRGQLQRQRSGTFGVRGAQAFVAPHHFP